MQEHPIHQLPQLKSMTSTDLPALLSTNTKRRENFKFTTKNKID